jgi:hypothetical protein
MSGDRHPDTQTVANLRAGLVGGFRGRRLAAHVARCTRCAATADELAAVSSFLASLPDPALPETFEHRITAALAAEAVARTTAAVESAQAVAGTGPAAASPATTDPATSGRHSPDRVPAGRRPSAGPRPRRPAFRLRPAVAFVPVIAFLLAGFGYLLSGLGGSASSSSSSEAVASSSASASSPLYLAGPGAGPDIAQPAGFLVAASGTNYLRGTLAAQVRAEMDAQHKASSYHQPVPSASSSAGGVVSAPASSTQIPAGFTYPSRALADCVLNLTKHARPALVDQATYQGKAAYVIAANDHVWVVGRGCTASRPALITSAALNGAS